jgi:hypothetical protein
MIRGNCEDHSLEFIKGIYLANQSDNLVGRFGFANQNPGEVMTDSTQNARSMAEHEHGIHMEKFETMLKCEIHPEFAVIAALHYCAKNEMPAPQWLVVAATKLLCRLLGNNTSKKPGRAVSPCARYIQDMVNYERWDVVRETREKQVQVKEQVDALKTISSAPRAMMQERQQMHHWVGEDWLRALECASMLLETSLAHAGPEAIKKSYQTVERGRGLISSLRYYQFDRGLLSLLGVTIDFRCRGNKGVPLYYLTP